jgi:hypothetical protein
MPNRITLLVDDEWLKAIQALTAPIEDGEICEWLAVENLPFLPCQTCGVDVPEEIHAEEMGFCVPCQHAYFEEANQ